MSILRNFLSGMTGSQCVPQWIESNNSIGHDIRNYDNKNWLNYRCRRVTSCFRGRNRARLGWQIVVSDVSNFDFQKTLFTRDFSRETSYKPHKLPSFCWRSQTAIIYKRGNMFALSRAADDTDDMSLFGPGDSSCGPFYPQRVVGGHQ